MRTLVPLCNRWLLSLLFYSVHVAALAATTPGQIPHQISVGQSGTFSISVPIPALPGTAGMAPHLSLAYSSQGGIGPVGTGWSIQGVPKISRGPQTSRTDGFPASTHALTEAFYLDGERLVPITRSPASNTIEFRKETDDNTSIVASIGPSAVPTQFTVSTRSGLTFHLGGSANAMVSVNGQVFTWLCQRLQDSTGNYILFSYLNANGDYELESAQYSGHDAHPALAPYAEIRFEYASVPPFWSGYLAGSSLQKSWRLSRIVSRLLQPEFVAYTLTPEYESDTSGTGFELRSLQYAASGGSQFQPLRFSYAKAVAEPWKSSASFQLPVDLAAEPNFTAAAYLIVRGQDSSGARTTRLLYSPGRGVGRSYVASATGWTLEASMLPPTPFVTLQGTTRGVTVIDIDNDGRDDLVGAVRSGASVERFAYLQDAAGQWSLDESQAFPLALADSSGELRTVAKTVLNGDSRQDLLLFHRQGETRAALNQENGWEVTNAIAWPGRVRSGPFAVDADCSGQDEIAAVYELKNRLVLGSFRLDGGQWKSSGAGVDLGDAARDVVAVAANQKSCALVLVATRDRASGRVLSEAYLGTAAGLASNGALALSNSVIWSASGKQAAPRLLDLNGDDRLDVVVNERWSDGTSSSSTYIQVEQAGIPVWSAGRTVPFVLSQDSATRRSVLFADVNSDSQLDVIELQRGRPNEIGAYLGQAGEWIPAADYTPPFTLARVDSNDERLHLVDLNADGLVDVLYNRQDDAVQATCAEGSDKRGAFLNRGGRWECVQGYFPPEPLPSSEVSAAGVSLVDVNADGFVDLVYSYRSAAGVLHHNTYLNRYSEGQEQWSEASEQWRTPVVMADEKGLADAPFRFADINVDGRVDLIRAYQVASPNVTSTTQPLLEVVTEYFENVGAGFERKPFELPGGFVEYQKHGGRLSERGRQIGSQLIDIDGDRALDFVESYRGAFTADVAAVHRRVADGFQKLTYAPPVSLESVNNDGALNAYFTDINADGLPDYYYASGASAYFYIGTGAGWARVAAWDLPAEALSSTYSDAATRFVDLNGDGLLDVTYHIPSGEDGFSRGAFLNTGVGWTKASTSLGVPEPLLAKDGSDTGVRLIDVDGNGLPDTVKSLLKVNQPSERSAWLNVNRRASVLEHMTDSSLTATVIEYQALGEYRSLGADAAPTRIYEHGRAGKYPSISIAPASYVVARLTTDEGGGRSGATRYRYGDLRLHLGFGLPQGFLWKETIDEATGLVTRTQSEERPELVGRMTSEASGLLDNGMLRRVTLREAVWEAAELQGVSRAGGGTYRFWQQRMLESREFQDDLDGSPITSFTTRFEGYDAFSNVGKVVTERVDGSWSELSNVYSSDPLRARLGRLESATVVKGTAQYIAGTPCKRPACTTQSSEFEYDPTTLLLTREVAFASVAKYRVATLYEHDAFGNIREKTIRADQGGVPDQVEEYDYLNDSGRLLQSVRSRDGSISNEYVPGVSVALGLPARIRDQNSLVTTREYDGFGRLASETSPVGTKTESKLLWVSDIDPSLLDDLKHQRATRPQVCAAGTLPAWRPPEVQYASVKSASKVNATGGAVSLVPTIEIYDRGGRVIRRSASRFDGESVRRLFLDFEYDDFGRELGRSDPYFSGDASKWTAHRYDRLGRQTYSVDPNGACTRTHFAGNRISTTTWVRRNTVGRTSVVTRTATGAIEQVEDAKGGKVGYAYDADGKVVQITGATGAVVTLEYDEGGQRVSTNDPDSGRWTYEYDALQRLVIQKDPRNPGNPTRLTYDDHGRVEKLATADHETRWAYRPTGGSCHYRAIARVDKKSINAGLGPSYSEEYGYDALCRPEAVTISIGAGNGGPPSEALPRNSFVSRQEYDEFGRPSISRYPRSFAAAAFSTRNTYHAVSGELTQVDEWLPSETAGRRLWSLVKLNAAGGIEQERLGSTLQIATKFDSAANRIERISATNAAGKVFDTNYRYDLVGNLEARADVVVGAQSFKYDELDRLVAVINSNGTTDRRVHYDPSGRITYKSDVGHFVYGAACGQLLNKEGIRPHHAPCAIRQAADGPLGERYRYDVGGNLIHSPAANVYYTADGSVSAIHQRRVVGDSQDDGDAAFFDRYSYGPNGEQFLQYSEGIRVPAGMRSIATYKLGLFENEVRITGASKVVIDRFHISLGRRVIGMVEATDYSAALPGDLPAALTALPRDQRQSAGHLFFFVRDHAGSISVITNASGGPLQRFAFDPWGRSALAASPPVDVAGDALSARWSLGYTGHQHLLIGTAVSSLIHMGGRVYDSRLALFLSPDRRVTDSTSSQDLNPYMYAIGNPLAYVDPGGLGWLSDFVRDPVGELERGVRNTFREARRTVNKASGWINENARTIVAVAVAAVVVAYCPPCLANPMLGGLVAGAVQGGTATALYGGSASDVLEASVRGGATGAIGGALAYGAGTFISETGISAGSWQAATAHGVAGGVTAITRGEKFETGFLSAALTQAITHNTGMEGLDGGERIAANAALGGVTAEIGGGKFANGALFASFQVMFNDWLHPQHGRTLLEEWAALSPDIPQDFSNFVQGFGAGASFGTTVAVNDWLGVGNYVDTSSTAFLSGVGVGAVTGLPGAAALRGGAALGGTGTRVGTWLNTGRYWRLGPGVNPRIGNIGRPGTHVPRLSIGNRQTRWNPHLDLRVRPLDK